jgi:hypothetical protein
VSPHPGGRDEPGYPTLWLTSVYLSSLSKL